VKDDHLIVEAFDRHWRGAPKVHRIVYKAIPEPFTRVAALRNNEVDLIDTVPPNLASELERAGRIRVQRVPSTWIIYLGLNALRKPLSDVRVRQALNYATTRTLSSRACSTATPGGLTARSPRTCSASIRR